MPKKIPITEMRNWLNSYEEGKSEASIAEAARRDVRTIKKGIEQARRERDAQVARAELLKEALRKHQGDLLGIIEGILAALQVPSSNVEVPWKLEGSPSPIRLSGATVQHKLEQGWTVFFENENSALWELLQEHLRRDRMWEAVAQWEKAIAAHLEARAALQRKLANLLEKETGLRLEFIGSIGIESTTMRELYTIVLRKALRFPEGEHLEKDIKVISAGEVMLKSHVLAKTEEGREDQCKDSIFEALKKLRESQEAMDAIATYKEVEQSTVRAKASVEEISLLGLVPGQCRVCRRLGI